MAEAEQPQIDDLKRLLKRLEHAKPDSSDAPQPPPLPIEATPASKAAVAGNPAPSKDVTARSSPSTAPSPAGAGKQPAPRPILTWVAAGAATAALVVAAFAGLQPRLVSHPREQQAAAPLAKQQPAGTRQDSASAPPPAPPAVTQTATTGSAAGAPVTAPGPAKPEPQPQVVAVPDRPIAAQAEAPRPADPTPVPAETPAPSPAATTGPIPESPALRAAAPGPGRDKYESEARLDAYLERGQKLLDEGDLTAARSFFRRVAESGDPRGALAMGATYDAAYSGDLGIRADNTVAGEWYRRAMELGSKDALDRLERLEK